MEFLDFCLSRNGKLNNAIVSILKTYWFNHIRSVDDKTFYRMLGMRRSGNHAVMNWMLAQMPGKTALLNNMQHHPPQFTRHKKIQIKGLGRTNLLVSHEDRPLEDFFLRYNEKHFGKSKEKYTLLILRDPYNWLASWYAWQDDLGVRFRQDEVFRNHTISLWKKYARLYIKWSGGESHDANQKQVPVNYNRWTVDVEYRRELAHTLGLPFSDKGREKVSINGYGSSFSGTAFNRKASGLKVLERWKVFQDDPHYHALFDSEMIALAKQIFPDISPGFIKQVRY